jgi:DNA-binding GntR family transcriptional regulator
MAEAKYVRLAAVIREQIRSGALQPGELLPSTSDLKTRYGVGNDVVRMAMVVLVNEKLVVTAQGEGRWVWPGPESRLP